MSEVHKTPEEILMGRIYSYVNSKGKELLPSKEFFDDTIHIAVAYCPRCCNGDDSLIRNVRGNLEGELENARLKEDKEYFTESKSLCEACEKYGKPLPTLLELANATLDVILNP